jgi:hypothetical protein
MTKPTMADWFRSVKEAEALFEDKYLTIAHLEKIDPGPARLYFCWGFVEAQTRAQRRARDAREFKVPA